MSVINIQYTHSLAFDDIKTKLKAIIIEMQEKLEFRTEWESERELSFRRKGASGRIEIGDNRVELTVRLGIALRALKSSIKKEIHSVLERHLN